MATIHREILIEVPPDDVAGSIAVLVDQGARVTKQTLERRTAHA